MQISELIEELGGARQAGRILGASRGAVRGWVERGAVPADWWVIIKKKTGVSVDRK